jgi:Na+/H+ antiporter NhaD/arsenite permease-like protein
MPVNPLMILPFIAMLLAMAVLPYTSRRWWEKNYLWLSLALAMVPVAYYLIVLREPSRMAQTAQEYFSFIVLLGSLFIVAGGIHIRIKGKSTPLTNLFLLAAGACASNVLGTTGASMVLIRPYLRVNEYRWRPYHVVFFIFLVSNIGGGLTPVGDPPLFLGYLKGVPFFWIMGSVWPVWLAATGGLLAAFYVIDRYSFRRFESSPRGIPASDLHEEGALEGLHNLFFLAVIVGSVFVSGVPLLREALMIGAAAGSWLTTDRAIRRRNGFDLLPLKEVAVLFFGIFATMVPALDYLELHARASGLTTPGQFFWLTGLLSSVLDNAPTYLNSLSVLSGTFVGNAGGVGAAMPLLLELGGGVFIAAISVGAVFFGAATYIGNGPNLMVKSLADRMGAPAPSFGVYILKYSLPVLGPLFLILWLLFFS